MPRPKVRREMTTTAVAKELGMSVNKLVSWIDNDALPAPTYIDENGVRYFNKAWLDEAWEILNMKEGRVVSV